MLFTKLPDLLVGWPPVRRRIHSAARAPIAGPRDPALRRRRGGTHAIGTETNIGLAQATASTK